MARQRRMQFQIERKALMEEADRKAKMRAAML